MTNCPRMIAKRRLIWTLLFSSWVWLKWVKLSKLSKSNFYDYWLILGLCFVSIIDRMRVEWEPEIVWQAFRPIKQSYGSVLVIVVIRKYSLFERLSDSFYFFTLSVYLFCSDANYMTPKSEKRIVEMIVLAFTLLVLVINPIECSQIQS